MIELLLLCVIGYGMIIMLMAIPYWTIRAIKALLSLPKIFLRAMLVLLVLVTACYVGALL